MSAKFSWIVWLADGTTVQVDADLAHVTAGSAVFTRLDSGGYMAAAFAAGDWLRVSAMSQVSGYPNGWTVIPARPKPSRKRAASTAAIRKAARR